MHLAVWQACVRVGIRPPGVKDKWEDNDAWMQAQILAFDQIQEHDEFLKAGGAEGPV